MNRYASALRGWTTVRRAVRAIGLAVFLLPMTSFAVQAAQATVTYYYTDPQGTVLATTDAAGNILAPADYRPYGTQALGTPEAVPGYTGHVNDPDSGLVYMQARYYDPAVGRFLSADPVPQKINDVLGFGRYTYVQNNPIRNIDPDGRYHCSGSAEFCGKVDSYVSGVKTARDNLRRNGGERSDIASLNTALKQIGKRGEAGPTYVSGSLITATAHTDQRGTTTIDVMKLDAKGDSAVRYGAQAIAHEARHDYDVDHGGLKLLEAQVRDTETNAYKTSRSVDRGYGLDWKEGKLEDAIQTSVELWKDEQ